MSGSAPRRRQGPAARQETDSEDRAPRRRIQIEPPEEESVLGRSICRDRPGHDGHKRHEHSEQEDGALASGAVRGAWIDCEDDEPRDDKPDCAEERIRQPTPQDVVVEPDRWRPASGPPCRAHPGIAHGDRKGVQVDQGQRPWTQQTACVWEEQRKMRPEGRERRPEQADEGIVQHTRDHIAIAKQRRPGIQAIRAKDDKEQGRRASDRILGARAIHRDGKKPEADGQDDLGQGGIEIILPRETHDRKLDGSQAAVDTERQIDLSMPGRQIDLSMPGRPG